jgi:hypothetical protein
MTRIVSRTEEVTWGSVRAGPCHNGLTRASAAPTATDGSEEPQLTGFPAQQLGMMQVGDSDCGPKVASNCCSALTQKPGWPPQPDGEERLGS